MKQLLDVRLNNTSQLAGFAKKDDLEFFLREICGIRYVHEPLLAPTQEILDAFKKSKGAWERYELDFMALLRQREVEKHLDRAFFEMPTALLCSEPKPDHCHRRLVLEYLKKHWGDIQIIHL